MTNKRLIFGVVGIFAVAVSALIYSVGRDSGPAFIDPADKAFVIQGKAIYENSCAACHGVQLQGQPNWRERLPNGRLPAPPHDKFGHTWHHPDAMLFDMVKNGLVPGKTAPPGYESDMPAYATMLSDEEIIAVLTYIKSNWPPKVLQAQKEVTMQRRE
ncbi:c-type cytochrome [Pollutimonas harenae]|uniref:Cytochrome c n=1 Tax=Pollutimonas harenae TaxID=657015 RepID=A0A853GZS2_9BURK|nr:cytochrome c [Pollutimonas harenae]NYT85270.1 cytochrome c [Pollutimonas harenae]TEA72362.1 cytochrome c [Pollutimonas harenae]